MVEDSGRYVSAFPDVSIQMQNNNKKKNIKFPHSIIHQTKQKMKGETNQKSCLFLTLCARSRRLSERLTFFLLKLDAPELKKRNKKTNTTN